MVAVKFRIVVRIHGLFDGFGVNGPVKESAPYPQRSDLITGSPCSADFVGLVHVISLSEVANFIKA